MSQARSFKKIIALLTILSLVLFAAMYFVYMEIKSKNEKVSSVEQDLTQKNTRYDYLLSMQKLIKDSEVDIKKIDDSIVAKSADVAFIEKIESLAQSHDLDIQIESLNLSSDPKAENTSVSNFRIKANIEGLWGNIYLFISEMESLPIKVKINKFSLKNKDEIPTDKTKLAGLGKNWRGSFEISVLEYK
jgi:hypothetical protein